MTLRRHWKLACSLFAAAIAGAIVGRLLPPFVLDDPFWREFWTGPPAAGLFALGGAGVAYGAAWLGTRASRKTAKRQEWWDRAEWALGLAMSDKDVDRIVGLEALKSLSSEATETEFKLILAVIEAVSGEGPEKTEANGNVDTATPLKDNRAKGGP